MGGKRNIREDREVMDTTRNSVSQDTFYWQEQVSCRTVGGSHIQHSTWFVVNCFVVCYIFGGTPSLMCMQKMIKIFFV